MAEERTGVVTMKGNGVTLVGPEVKVGDQAPDFSVLAGDLSEVTLASSSGKVRLLSVVPSIDTPVCDQQTRRFNEEAAKLPGGIEVKAISVDLPWPRNASVEPRMSTRSRRFPTTGTCPSGPPMAP